MHGNSSAEGTCTLGGSGGMPPRKNLLIKDANLCILSISETNNFNFPMTEISLKSDNITKFYSLKYIL